MQDDSTDAIFNRRFLAYFAVFLVICAMGYIAAITFIAIPEKNQRFADTVLGFLLGTLLTTIVVFFYGSSKQSQSKDQTIRDAMASNPVAVASLGGGTGSSVVAVTPPATVSVEAGVPIGETKP